MRTSSMPYLLIVLIVYGQIHDIRGNSCFNYTDLSDLSLRHPDFVYDPNTTAISDNIGFKEDWYRAGNLDMPNTRPDVNRCGTAWPFYLEDPVPQNREIQENRACLGDVYDNCYYYVNIKVKNCGSYRVYKLMSVGFNSAAYCFSVCSNCNLVVSTSPTSTAHTTAHGTQSPTTPEAITNTTIRPATPSASTTTGAHSPTSQEAKTETTIRSTTPRGTVALAISTTQARADDNEYIRDRIENSTVCLKPYEFVLYILSCFLVSMTIILTVWIVKKKGCQPPKEKSNMDEERIYYTVDKKLSSAYSNDYDVITK